MMIKGITASVVAVAYTLVAFLAELPGWVFRPSFYLPTSRGQWIEAEAAALSSMVGAMALLYICGAIHGTVQLWLARARGAQERDSALMRRTDMFTTFLPVVGMVLGFIVAHITGFWAFAPGARGLELAIQAFSALLVVSACRHDIWDTVRYWHWRRGPADH
jgi:hypothetical protein